MKYKEYIKKIKNEEYGIPNIYENIKDQAYSRKPLYFKTKNRLKQNLKTLALSFSPILTIAIIFIIIGIGTPEKDFTNSVQELSYFSDPEEINDLLLNKQLQEDRYLEHFQPKGFLFSESGNAKKYISITDEDNPEYDADIVRTEGDYIYYASASTFHVIKTMNGNMQRIFSDTYADYEERASLYRRINQIYITDRYAVLLYNSYSDPELTHPYTKYNITALIYQRNGDGFSRVKTYRVYGNYLDSVLIDNALYLVTASNINEYKREDESVLPIPVVYENEIKKQIEVNDIGYLDDFVGNTYTVLSSISLDSLKISETILLSYDKWDIIYGTKNSFYLFSSFKNYNMAMDFGSYTSIIKYRYNSDRTLEFNSAYRLKGAVADRYSFSEYQGYLRVAITVDEYQVTEGNLFNQVSLISTENNIYVFEESNTKNGNALVTVGKLKDDGEEIDGRIRSVRFYNEFAYIIASDGFRSALNEIKIKNNGVPIITDSKSIPNSDTFLHCLDDDNAIGLSQSINDSAYSVSFYSIEGKHFSPWNNGKYNIPFHFFGSPSNWLSAEALNNPNAIFDSRVANSHYFGFAIHEKKRNLDEYILFKIHTEEKTYTVFHFSNQSELHQGKLYMINRLVSITDSDTYFYTISDGLIKSYDSDFEEIGTCSLPFE